MGVNGYGFKQKYLPSQVGCQYHTVIGTQKYGNNTNGGGNNNGFRNDNDLNNNGFHNNNKQTINGFRQPALHQAQMTT